MDSNNSKSELNPLEENEILELLNEVKSKISEWQNSEDHHESDQGFQSLLERESELENALKANRL